MGLGAAFAPAACIVFMAGPWGAPANASTATGDVVPDAVASHAASISEWRQLRDERLRSEDGWLTLVGLDWLQHGANTVGSGAGNRIRLPGGPEAWGTVHLGAEGILFERAPGAPVTVNDEALDVAALMPDDAGQPTIVRSGDLSFHVIHRESYALRVKDRQAPARVGFRGIENYPTDYTWRVDARFIPAEPGATIEIGDVLGQVSQMPVWGYAEFERDGRTHRLVGVTEQGSDSPWFIFSDRTNGRETYGAGRFVYGDGAPSNGRLILDFNKAYNPPCAFSEYSTCPLPPQQNRLDLAVTAGEKVYHLQPD